MNLAALAAALAVVVSPTTSPATLQTDTLEAVGRVNRALKNHYGSSFRVAPLRRPSPTGSLDRYCDGDDGAVCHGGDPDRGNCPIDTPCHPTEEFLVDGLLEVAMEYPGSGYALGQAIYALTKFGYVDAASTLVNSCAAEEWWCEALGGYFFYTTWNVAEAEARFRRALEGAPPSVACSYGDAMWLLGEWDQRVSGPEALPEGRNRTSDWDCDRRLSASDTLWWWADPLLSVEGNDRWVDHIARAMSAQFRAEIEDVRRGGEVPQRYQDHDWAMRIRRGSWDSYELRSRSELRLWTSTDAARYHFVPDMEPGGFSNPTWRLDGTLLDEGYTPEEGPFIPIPVQLARFREGETLRLAVAASLAGSPLRRVPDVLAHLVLSDGPGSFPVRMEKEFRRETPRFLGQAPTGPYLVGVEVMSDIGIGWFRQPLSPLSPDGAEISDLLLFDPSEGEEPVTLPEAAAAMLGSTTLQRGSEVGVFWETYGAMADAELEFELTLERVAGGLVDRLIGLFPGGREEGRGRVTWTETASPGAHARSIILQLAGIEPGEYSLALRVAWPGQAPLERTRALAVE